MRSPFAALWQLAFTLRLSRTAGTSVSRKMLHGAVSRLPNNQVPVTDGAQAFNLTLAQRLHASAILLEQELPFSRADSLSDVHRAFVNTGSWMARAAVCLWLRLVRDLCAGVEPRGPATVAKALWSDGIAAEDRRTDDAVSLRVLNGPFREYFWNVSRSDLTPILCACDTAWQKEVTASDKPTRVDISSTLSGGALIGEFTFRKAARTNP